MWDKLRKQAALELEELHRLLEIHQPLLTECAGRTPSPIELSALAAMLHAFYNGLENILKRIAVEVDSRPSGGQSWHRDLLEAMAKPGLARPAVLSADLAERMQEYLEFRHVFRHAYTFYLRWEKMQPLISDCQDVLMSFEAEVNAFLRTVQ